MNAEIWKSADHVQSWVAEADRRERRRHEHRQYLVELLAFDEDAEFTFLDLGAGTGRELRVTPSWRPTRGAPPSWPTSPPR